MKRKPSPVGVVLFILLFVILYFVEQKLHILGTTVEPAINLEIQEVPLGQATYKPQITG